MRRVLIGIAVLQLIALIGERAKAEISFPYFENFDDKVVGNSFDDWDSSLGTILGPDSRPFGENIPFNENYLFISGSQGQSSSTAFSEISENVNLSLKFCSLPNPNYDPPGAFRGGADFLITAASEYSRSPRIGVEIEGEMWQSPDDLEVYFLAEYLDGSSLLSVPIGTIRHGEIYSLDITLNPITANIHLVGPSTDIQYEYVLEQVFSLLIHQIFLQHHLGMAIVFAVSEIFLYF